MNLDNVSSLDIDNAKKRIPELNINLFVDACNEMTGKVKNSNEFNQSNYYLCDDINLKVQTVNLDKMVAAYNALVSFDKELSVDQMQAIILHKFNGSIVNYDSMIKRFKSNLTSALNLKVDSKNADEINVIDCKISDAKFDLDILLKHYKKHDLFMLNDLIANINGISGYRDYQYRPIRYEDLANALFLDKPVKFSKSCS